MTNSNGITAYACGCSLALLLPIDLVGAIRRVVVEIAAVVESGVVGLANCTFWQNAA